MSQVSRREVVGHEALARGPRGSALASPVAMFAAAAEAGRTAELDWVCLAAAFDGFLAAGLPPGLSLFVNMNLGLRLEDCPADLLAVVGRAEAGLRVFVEVNDEALARDPSGVLATVDRARELGWGVSVDDVGTSLGCLAVLPMVRADVIKLDLRQIRDRPVADNARVVAPLLRHIEATGAVLVAKGIETPADLRLAHALGAAYGQGHHLGVPGELPAHLHQPRSVVPMLGAADRPPPVDCPFELVRDRRRQRMSEPEMRAIGGLFLERALGAESRPVVLIGMGDHVAEELGGPGRVPDLARLAEQAVLLGLFGVGLAGDELPGARSVRLPRADSLARQPFLVVLTESVAFAMVAVRPIGTDDLIDVVMTQDPFAVDEIAQHLLRRIPIEDGAEILPASVLRSADPAADDEPAEVPKPRRRPLAAWVHRS